MKRWTPRTRRITVIAGMSLALAVAAAVIVTRSSLGAGGGGTPNDSRIFGFDPADVTRLPPRMQTSIASDLATRAVLIQTPLPTRVPRNSPVLLSPPLLGPPPTPVTPGMVDPAAYAAA